MFENTKLKRKRLQIARHTISDILKEEGFKITKRIKFGPRFFVAQGIKNGKISLFKICLFTHSVDHDTNDNFSREISFLNFVGNSNLSFLKKSTPQVSAHGLEPRSWYVREYLKGKAQNIKGGNVRFKKSFFNQKNLNWIIKFFTSLQSIKRKRLPVDFQRLLYPPDFNKHLWIFIKLHLNKLDQYFKSPGITKPIISRFKKYISLYNKSPQVLSHKEPYSCHFLKKENRFLLIDWENINWANPAHDPVVIWMRAYEHQKWQNTLYQRFRNRYQDQKNFDLMWTMEVFIQSFFNVISYQFYHDQKDLEGLTKFSDKKTKEILNNDFKI